MTDKLLEAIQATRDGQLEQAQNLLAEELQDNPNNEDAWFLLSNLVDSPEHKSAYLSKVIALDPNHEKAKQQLVQIKSASPPVAEPADEMDEEGWLAALTEDDGEEEEFKPFEEMEESVDDAVAAITDESISTTEPTETTTQDNDRVERERKLRQYNLILAGLGILMLVILLMIIFG